MKKAAPNVAVSVLPPSGEDVDGEHAPSCSTHDGRSNDPLLISPMKTAHMSPSYSDPFQMAGRKSSQCYR